MSANDNLVIAHLPPAILTNILLASHILLLFYLPREIKQETHKIFALFHSPLCDN